MIEQEIQEIKLEDKSDKEVLTDVFMELHKLENVIDQEHLINTLHMWLSYTTEYNRNSELPPLFINSPEEISSGDKAQLGNRHKNYYSKDIKDLVNDYRNWDLLVLQSGMYGFKSSFSFGVIDGLKRKHNLSNTILVADVMDEEIVTARSYWGNDKVRDAIPYGLNTFGDNDYLLDVFMKQSEDVIVLDEFTFLPEQVVLNLIEKCKDYGKKLILLGLDTNAFGQTLPIFENDSFKKYLNDEGARRIKTKSFVGMNTADPNGIGTIRYFKVPHFDDLWMLDLGSLPLVISKYIKEVKYFPSKVLLANTFENDYFRRLISYQEDSLISEQEKFLSLVCNNHGKIQL